MERSTAAVGLLLLILIQCTFVESGGWWWGRRKRYGCRYPRSRYGNNGIRSDYFYGTTSLFKGKKRSFRVNTWTLKHSLLMFRGKIFEWGLGSPKSYRTWRNPSECKIKWSWRSKGTSKCSLSDAMIWTRHYRSRYGRYRLFSNNCHYFVNRLVRYLNTNCGR